MKFPHVNQLTSWLVEFQTMGTLGPGLTGLQAMEMEMLGLQWRCCDPIKFIVGTKLAKMGTLWRSGLF